MEARGYWFSCPQWGHFATKGSGIFSSSCRFITLIPGASGNGLKQSRHSTSGLLKPALVITGSPKPFGDTQDSGEGHTEIIRCPSTICTTADACET